MKLKSRFSKDTIVNLLVISTILFLSFIFSFQTGNNIWHKANKSVDSSVFTYVARVILDGGMPYLDTFDHKGPIIYLINVIGIIISPWRGIYVLELFSIISVFFFIYKTARLVCSKSVSLLVLFTTSAALFQYFQWGNYTEEYALPFIASSLFIFTDYFMNSRISIPRLLACGMGFGTVCFLRLNMIAVWFVMCQGVLVRCIKQKRIKDICKYLLVFIIGVSIVCIPITIWLYKNGAIEAFFTDYFIFNTLYSKGVDSLTMMANRESTFVYFFNDSLVLLAFCYSIYCMIKERREFDILHLLYFICTLFMLSMSGREYDHYGLVLVPALTYPIARFWENGYDQIKKGECYFVYIALFLLVFHPFPRWLDGIDMMFQRYSTRNEDHIGKTELEIANIIKENTAEEDQILVCGNWDLIYLLSDRFACTKYSYQNNACTVNLDNMTAFLEELEENNPKVIVLRDNTVEVIQNVVMEYMKDNEYELIMSKDGSYHVDMYLQRQ